ncbi:MAG: hypothetical protein A3B44_00065 [Candidatus Levybacteria bacterium RIFCSPLOWO2_01_FULL_38_21]|nr:MAG: hypothetical protein A3B44_00065 [Candidatus Levybacteria bacterium RIFCSPLOWO2_01_FULL_38_21]
MEEKEGQPIRLEGSDACGLEGVRERPMDCPNNPWRHPENHRPGICRQCPGNSEIWKVAKGPLPPIHIQTKQGEQIILPKPKT